MRRLFLIVVVRVTAGGSVRAQAELSLPEARGTTGGLAVVPVVISEGESVAALQFTLAFDAALLSVTGDDSILPGGSIADHSVGVTRESGRLRVVIFSSSLASLKRGRGALVHIVFQVARGAATGASSTISFTGVQASNSAAAPLTVSAREGKVTVSGEGSAPVAGASDLVFPHVVNGSFSGGSFATTFFFVSRTGIPASGEIQFFRSDGTPMTVSLAGGQAGSSFPFTVSETGAAFLQTDGAGALAAGYARVIASGPIGGALLFRQADGIGQIVTEAGVGAASPATHFSVPLLYLRNAANTGIALVNSSGRDTVC